MVCVIYWRCVKDAVVRLINILQFAPLKASIEVVGDKCIKCYVLTVVKSLGHSDQKWCIATILLEHCDFAVGALRLSDWCVVTV